MLPAWGNASTVSAVNAVQNSRYRPMPPRMESGRGLGGFDPDNIVTFVDEEDEVMEHEYMMRKRRRRTYIFATVILAAVGLALAGGTSWMFVGWKQNSSGGIGVVSDSSGSQQMPIPLSDLDRVCSIRNMATEEGHKDCEGLCSPAMCCMKAGRESCYSQHEKICEMVSIALRVEFRLHVYLFCVCSQPVFTSLLSLTLIFRRSILHAGL